MKKFNLKSILRYFGILAALALAVLPMNAAAPLQINYQGKLTNNSGDPIIDPNKQIKFQFFGSLAANDPIGSEITKNVNVANGVFSTVLDVPAGVFSGAGGDNRFLEVRIDGVPLSPRQKLVSAPYALAVGADSITSGEIVNGSVALVDLAVGVLDAGNIGGGELGPTVIASSIAVASVENASIVGMSAGKLTGALPALNGAFLTNLTPANISAGSLNSNVIVSSIAVASVENASIVGMSAGKLTGALPALNGAFLTNLTPANISAGSLNSNVIVSSIAVASVENASIVGMSAGKLTGALPALNGASLTNLTPANISAGSLNSNVIVSSVAAGAVKDLSIDTVSSTKITGGAFGTGQNVGIGGAAGATKLTVTGTMKVTSDTTFEKDIYVDDKDEGLILKSPNNNCWRIKVDNAGNVDTDPITCP